MSTANLSEIKSFSVEQIESIEDACAFAQRWLFPITQNNKYTMLQVLQGTDPSFGTPMLRQYIRFLRPYTQILGLGNGNQPREADCVASGIVFFYGCLLYIFHFPNWGQYIEDIFLYNLLYILVDHYIDDLKIEPAEKTIAIEQMYILIHDPLQHLTLPLIDPILKTIAMVYHKLITRRPQIRPSILKLFQAEIDGLRVQTTSNSTRSEYMDIALRKGGLTMEVMNDIVGNTDPRITAATYHIGTIMQLIDDSVDVIADRRNGIHTIATHDLDTTGTLDRLWIEIMNRIRHLDSKFTFYIFIYTVFAVYVPDRIPEAYTPELRRHTNSLNLFDYGIGCDGSALLVKSIMDELATQNYN